MRGTDQPGIATLKVSLGEDPSGGMIYGTSTSTLGECHASVNFRTGLPLTIDGASLLVPMYEANPGKAIGGNMRSRVCREAMPA